MFDDLAKGYDPDKGDLRFLEEHGWANEFWADKKFGAKFKDPSGFNGKNSVHQFL